MSVDLTAEERYLATVVEMEAGDPDNIAIGNIVRYREAAPTVERADAHRIADHFRERGERECERLARRGARGERGNAGAPRGA